MASSAPELAGRPMTERIALPIGIFAERFRPAKARAFVMPARQYRRAWLKGGSNRPIALGMVGDMAWPASKALIADLIPPDLRVTGYTLWRIATNAGWAAGLAIGGFLVERSFDLMFIGDAATSLAFAGVALVIAGVLALELGGATAHA